MERISLGRAHHRAVHAHRQRDHRHRGDQGRHRSAARTSSRWSARSSRRTSGRSSARRPSASSPSRRSACRKTHRRSTANSLFWVILISLSLSWVSSITVTPLLSYLLFKPIAGGASGQQRSVRRPPVPDLPPAAGAGAPLPLGGGGPVHRGLRRGALRLHAWSSRAFSRPRPGRSSWWTCSCRPAPTSAKRRRSPATSSGTSRRSPASPMSRRSSAAAACASCSSTVRNGRTEPSCSSWSMSMTGGRSTG